MQSVLVVGAGIAGLTAAYQLSWSDIDITVLEAFKHVGGRMVTDSSNGYVIDCGAQFFSSAYPIITRLIAEMGLAHGFVEVSLGCDQTKWHYSQILLEQCLLSCHQRSALLGRVVHSGLENLGSGTKASQVATQ